MQNTDKSRIGGILSIVSGACGILGALMIVFMILFLRYWIIIDSSFSEPPQNSEGFWIFMAIFYAISAIFMAALGALGIVGGIFALKRKRWGVALAGAIAGVFTFFPCGIAAIIFVAMSRPEFIEPGPTIPTPSIPYSQG